MTIVVSNAMWFPAQCNIGGMAIYVGAQTVYPGWSWHLDVYDDQTNHVGYLNGSIDSSGYCAYPGVTGPGFSLNNTDGSGNQNPSTSYMLVMTASATSIPTNPPYTKLTNNIRIEPPWNFAPTYTIVCYQQMFASWMDGWTETRDLVGGMWSAEDPWHPNVLGFVTSPFEIQISNDWTQVTSYMTSPYVRDFVYMGHGSPDIIGDTASRGLAATNVEALLLNNSGNGANAYNRHPFRFVFLDGCNTANGIWPTVFGIPKETLAQSDFINKRGIRPRAFMGWAWSKVSGGVIMSHQLNPDHITWVTTFWSSWTDHNQSTGQPRYNLKAAADAAKTASNGSGYGLSIYGAQDLIIDY